MAGERSDAMRERNGPTGRRESISEVEHVSVILGWIKKSKHRINCVVNLLYFVIKPGILEFFIRWMKLGAEDG